MQSVLKGVVQLFQLFFFLLPSLSDESNAYTAPQIFLSVLFNICCRSTWNHIYTHTQENTANTHTHSQLRTEQKLVLYNVSSNAVAALQLISWVGLEECCRSTFLEKTKNLFQMISLGCCRSIIIVLESFPVLEKIFLLENDLLLLLCSLLEICSIHASQTVHVYIKLAVF